MQILSRLASHLYKNTLIKPEHRSQLKQLVIELRITSYQSFFIHLNADEVFVSKDLSPADVILSGKLGTFLQLFRTKDLRKAVQTGLDFQGDDHTLLTLNQIFLSSSVQWEELLAPFIGDIAATTIFEGLQKVDRTVQQRVENFQADTKAYMVSEKMTPSRSELKNFFDESNTLRMEIDQLEARLNTLSREEV